MAECLLISPNIRQIYQIINFISKHHHQMGLNTCPNKRIFVSSPKLRIFTESKSAENSAHFRPENSDRNLFRWITGMEGEDRHININYAIKSRKGKSTYINLQSTIGSVLRVSTYNTTCVQLVSDLAKSKSFDGGRCRYLNWLVHISAQAGTH